MKSKLFSRDEIIAQFHDGQTIMTGGFAFHGLPNELLDCLIASGAKHLTNIALDASCARLMHMGIFDKVIMAHSGSVRENLELVASGKIEVEFCPMGTVAERIPPRQRVRRDAPIELPHILMLCDDHEKVLIEPIAAHKASLKKLYDFDLMEGGGHITGWLVDGKEAEAFNDRLTEYTKNVGKKYEGLKGTPVVFAVGDGNHSLATAKSCNEEMKKQNPGVDLSDHPARYALVELENIHDPAQVFEPIHRVVTACDSKALLKALEQEACAEEGFEVHWYSGTESGVVHLDPAKSQLAVGVLQGFLDGYLKEHEGEIDYIHDDDALIALAKQENAIGFLLPAMEKSQLFRGVIADGILPRKTFSMGHSREKRYYLEGRKIK